MGNFKGWSAESVKAVEEKQLDSRLKAKAAKQPKESANRITANMIRAINMQPGCVAYRINNVGVWDAEKQIHRKGNTQKGVFDIAATIKGRAVWLEVKSGRDKPSTDQLIFQQEIRSAGGVAEFVYSTDNGLELLTKLLIK